VIDYNIVAESIRNDVVLIPVEAAVWKPLSISQKDLIATWDLM